MPTQLTVVACNECGAYYETEEEALQCELKDIAQAKAEEQEREKRKQSKIEYERRLNEIRLTCKDLRELPQMLTDFFLKYYHVKFSLTTFQLRYDEEVSCTHAAPIGKETNWDGKKPVPRSYVGYRGRWNYSMVFPSKNVPTFFHWEDYSLGIHTDSSSGSAEYSYSAFVYLFEDDFPLIKAARLEKEALMQAAMINAKEGSRLQNLYEQEIVMRIADDPRIEELTSLVSILEAEKLELENRINEYQKDIEAIDQEIRIKDYPNFVEQTRVSSEFDYDCERLSHLNKMFASFVTH